MRFLTALVAMLFLAQPAWSKPLTDQSIQQWAGSYSALMDWAETNAVEPDVPPGPNMFRRSMESMQPRRMTVLFPSFI